MITVLPRVCRHKDRLVKCRAAANSVRVTTSRDGSITFHFSEAAELTQQQQPDSSLLPTQPALNDSYALIGASSDAPPVQHVSNVLASFRASSAVVGQGRQPQTSLQQSKQTNQVQNTPSWARKLEWNKPARVIPKNGSGTRQRTANRYQPPLPSQSPAEQDFHSAEMPRNLDDQLDFDSANTQLLLRAYSSRAAAGRLDAALEVLEGVVAAGRLDVLTK